MKGGEDVSLKESVLGETPEAAEGGDEMAEVPDELEVERVKNLISGFGWEISKQEILTDRLVLTIDRKRETPAADESAGPG